MSTTIDGLSYPNASFKVESMAGSVNLTVWTNQAPIIIPPVPIEPPPTPVIPGSFIVRQVSWPPGFSTQIAPMQSLVDNIVNAFQISAADLFSSSLRASIQFENSPPMDFKVSEIAGDMVNAKPVGHAISFTLNFASPNMSATDFATLAPYGWTQLPPSDAYFINLRGSGTLFIEYRNK